MNKEELKEIWGKFVENKDFKLNPDTEKVNEIAEIILKNEEKTGLKLCPCQINTVCPCNFKIQKNWKNKGTCICNLFVKK
ncbi:hypothetical protein CL621_01175 [archaeon]|nr:hypothetical protein [archaeon]|tara:strand:+ start:1582 stop:1821 length:240 start_codon:yes stop_codon:yes gene_type:complete